MSSETTAIDENKDTNMLKIDFIPFIILLMVCLIAGCNNSQASNLSLQSRQSQNTSKKALFNPSDKSIDSNGYMTIAVNKINGMGPKSVWEDSIPVTAEMLTKSPYSALGKPHKITGEVYKVEEFPPIGGLEGHWFEILLLAENPNSLLGLTTVDFMYNGDISKIKSGQLITCAGLFVGTFQSENTLGGKDETYVLVGNDLRFTAGLDLTSEQSQSKSFIAHVASWKTAAKAEKVSKQLEGQGIKSWAIRMNIPGRGLYYRVYAGPFDSRESAVKTMKKLKRKGIITYFAIEVKSAELQKGETLPKTAGVKLLSGTSGVQRHIPVNPYSTSYIKQQE
ncbi:MAG TPA: SPOR domain-containing protein [Bacteroidales bacterium]|nr:SPOR domain-containing protein [Bacteroidales bacterium]